MQRIFCIKQFSISADKIEIETKKNITRYLGSIEMQIPVGQTTEIHSDSKTIGNGLQIFEGNVKLTAIRIEITFKTASPKSTEPLT
ncbi:MAG: hypothetical protein ACI9UD_002290 [Glaciecola sp.]|jgi:hypothetical protein